VNLASLPRLLLRISLSGFVNVLCPCVLMTNTAIALLVSC